MHQRARLIDRLRVSRALPTSEPIPEALYFSSALHCEALPKPPDVTFRHRLGHSGTVSAERALLVSWKQNSLEVLFAGYLAKPSWSVRLK